MGRKVDLWHFYTNALSHLLSSQTHAAAVLESIKEKKKKRKENREQELEKDLREWEHFLNEGEKERKEGGDKEIRTNVFGGKKKKDKRMDEMKWEKIEIK